jgi:hypothetical protein
MRILFLIGNGFDINLGLNTKYSDVLNNYISVKTTDKNISMFQEELRKNRKEWWSDLEKQLGDYTEYFDNNNYINYENIYKSLCLKIIELFSYEQFRIDYDKYKAIIPKDFMKHISEFYTHLPPIDKKAVLADINTTGGKLDFHYDFLSFNYTEVINKLVSKSKEFYSKDHYAVKTDLINNRLVTHHLGQVINIHGSLEEDFIMGVDNIEQIKNIELQNNEIFTTKIVKPKLNTSLKRDSEIVAKRIIDFSQIICTFGMSIGITDKTWWNYILDWLGKKNNRHLIIFYHNDKIDIRLTGTKLDNINEALNKLLINHSPLVNEESKQVINRIHIVTNKQNMFNMNILKDEDNKPNKINIWDDRKMLLQGIQIFSENRDKIDQFQKIPKSNWDMIVNFFRHNK